MQSFENKCRVAAILDNIPDIAWVKDTVGRFVGANQPFSELCGVALNELLGKTDLDIWPSELAEKYMADDREVMKSGKRKSVEEPLVNCSGESRWIETIKSPVFSDTGEVIGTTGIARDITDRKLAAVALQESEQRFRSFVENANDIVFSLSPTGVFTYVPPTWTEKFGYEVDETIGQPFVPFVHPEDVPICYAFLKLVMETGEKQSGVEYRVRHKNGTWLWYTASGSVIRDAKGEITSFIGIGRDITERKHSEELLRQSEEKFAAAFRASPDSININSMDDGCYLDINEGFTALFGFTAEEAVGKTSVALGIWVYPEDRSRLLSQLASEGAVKDFEAQLRPKSGSTFTGRISSRLIKIDGKTCILSITHDISEHEYIQKELIKAQKLESISILASGIAHNFNNVLTGVIGYISYAKNHLEDTDLVLQILESAEKASFRASKMARQLLTFSKGGDPVRRPVSVEKLVQESMSLFLSGSNVKGKITCSSPQTILVDSEQINQSMNNIVLNAVHSMPQGGLLAVTIDAITLRKNNMYGLQPGKYARIAFTDNGCGIESKNLLKVFDPYFTTKDNGTGLGLSTTHSIIRKHDGHIDISSKVNHGTTVTIILPSSDESPVEESSESGNTGTGSTAGISILVVDDEESIRDVAAKILGDLGYTVKTCTSGEEAIALYASSREGGTPFSVVLMDLVIPGGMGGEEAARLIRCLDPEARLVVSTGYSKTPVLAKYKKYGFCGAIAKPYNARVLIQVLEKIL